MWWDEVYWLQGKSFGMMTTTSSTDRYRATCRDEWPHRMTPWSLHNEVIWELHYLNYHKINRSPHKNYTVIKHLGISTCNCLIWLPSAQSLSMVSGMAKININEFSQKGLPSCLQYYQANLHEYSLNYNITSTRQGTIKLCAYFMEYTVGCWNISGQWWHK